MIKIGFQFNAQGCEDFNFIPRCGHINAKAAKPIVLSFKSTKPILHKAFALLCETTQIIQDKGHEFKDWDDSMSVIRYATKTEFDWLQKKREEEAQRRRQEELEKAALLAKQKPGAKKAAPVEKKKEEKKKQALEKEDIAMPVIDPNEEANIPIEDPVVEPEHAIIDKTEKTMTLKTQLRRIMRDMRWKAKRFSLSPRLCTLLGAIK